MSAVWPAPPAPIVSTLLLAAFQSTGTVHDVPEIINTWITNQHHDYSMVTDRIDFSGV